MIIDIEVEDAMGQKLIAIAGAQKTTVKKLVTDNLMVSLRDYERNRLHPTPRRESLLVASRPSYGHREGHKIGNDVG